MTNFRFACKILLLGLTLAQVLSTIQVYTSNLDYYRVLNAIQEAGYLVVPNQNVFSSLKHFGPAFCGGLFFSFTAGASLTIISSGAAWAWVRLFSRNKIVLFLIIAPLPGGLVFANIHGFSPLITWYLLSIPAIIFIITLKRLPEMPEPQSPVKTIFPVITFLMLALTLIIWKPSKINIDRFLDIRDYLLLSSPIGKRLNAFYYKNSLYSTQVFKSYGQQLIKTSHVGDISDPSLKARMTRILLFRDYLPVQNVDRPDLRISVTDSGLSFYNHRKLILTSSLKQFFSNPAETFKQYEDQTDPHKFFRAVTMFSILFVGALILYLFIYVPCHLASGFFLKSWHATIKAGILCPLAFLVILFIFNTSDSGNLDDTKNLAEAISSKHLHTRITGLKYILRNKIDIAQFPSYQSMLRSNSIPERYWLAKTLGVSRTPETRESLHKLLDDPHFNVVCMALDSIGRRGKKADIRPILTKIKASDNWYDQWYAYRALRRLGWMQKKSN